MKELWWKAVGESQHSIAVNPSSIPNDQGRHRHGEAIATSFAGSTVHQVISKRMVKNQQMRWTEWGLIGCCRCARALNEGPPATSRRWYPGLKAAPEPAEEEAA